RVIYAGSFSKCLLPGLRLGYLVVPTELIGRFHETAAIAGSTPSLADQAVAADFIVLGHFAKHIRRMRELYLNRRDVLRTELESQLSGLVQVTDADAGTHLVARLSPGVLDRDVCEA